VKVEWTEIGVQHGIRNLHYRPRPFDVIALRVQRSATTVNG